MRDPVGRGLVVDDDVDIADLVEEFVSDEGYVVRTLHDRDLESLRAAVERVRPDRVLVDGAIPGVFSESWVVAAWMRERA